jgi:biotin carboxyl carrier protein
MEEDIRKELHPFPYDGSDYKTRFTRKFATRKPYEPDDPKKITAFIPGTIIKVIAKEKHKVRKGDSILVLSAMKMNNILLAPVDGEILKIHVKKGDTVKKNQLLAEIK